MTAGPGFTIGIIQFALSLSWVAYAIYFPQLAKEAGIAAAVVPWILAADQAVFAIADWTSGVHADRVLAAMRRLVPVLVGATLVSTLALAALPWVAPSFGAVGLLTLTAVWVVTTAALRAPPMALLGRFMPPSSRPGIAAFTAVGIGLAGAAGPYLAKSLRGVDPRLPLAMAGAAVMVAALALYYAERRLPQQTSGDTSAGTGPEPLRVGSAGSLAVIAGLLALGFQAQVLLLSTQIARIVPAVNAENFIPVFWGAFGIAAMTAGYLFRRFDARTLMIWGGFAATIGAASASVGASVATVAGGHALAGIAWGVLLTGLFCAALGEGTRGLAGKAAAIVFGALAAAAFVRIATAAAGWPRSEVLGPGIAWSSSVAWLVGALVVALFASNSASRAGITDTPGQQNQ